MKRVILVSLCALLLLSACANEVHCVSNSDCKLIYSSCSCKAADVSSSEKLDSGYPAGAMCEVNMCTVTNVSAICANSRCVRSDGHS